jgi:hypothetical protein
LVEIAVGMGKTEQEISAALTDWNLSEQGQEQSYDRFERTCS